jgi:dolichol-phosphate mannosyltransferase
VTAHENELFLEQRPGKLGLGTAYIHGFKWALEREYDFIFEMDADFSHSSGGPGTVIQCLCRRRGRRSGRLPVCPRGKPKTGLGQEYLILRRLPVCAFSYLAACKRFHRGFVCYTREVLESINFDEIQFTGYAFQIEMKFTAWKLALKW